MNRNKALKYTVFILLLVLYGSYLMYKITLPVADDLPRQMKIGQELLHGHTEFWYKNTLSYAVPDEPFYNTHWLYGVICYLLFLVIGWSGLVIFKVILGLTIFSLLFKLARKKANFWAVVISSLVFLLLAMDRTLLRPELFSYLFVVIFLWILYNLKSNPDSKKIYWLIPLQLLWVNIHVFFTVGPMIVGGFILEKIIENRRNIRALKDDLVLRKLILLVILLPIVSLVNPRGIDGVFYHYDTHYPTFTSENQSPFFYLKQSKPWSDVPLYLLMPFMALLFTSFLVRWRVTKKVDIFLFLASVATAGLTLSTFRGSYFLAIILLLALSSNLSALWDAWSVRFNLYPTVLKYFKYLIYSLIIIITVTLISLSINKRIGIGDLGIGLADESNASIEFFKENHLRGPIFNDADVGSYLAYYLYPEERVWMDNRFGDAYSASFVKDLSMPIVADEGAWKAALEKYHYNAIFFYQYDQGENIRSFLEKRVHDPDWSLVYVDRYCVILLRNTPENKSVIDRYGITRENATVKLKNLEESDNYEDAVAAADTYNIIGLEDIATRTFLDIVAKWPNSSKIWLILGEWEIGKGDERSPILSAMFIDKAISMGEETAEAYQYLGAAYARLNRPILARKALEKALKINPDRIRARELLDELNKEKQ